MQVSPTYLLPPHKGPARRSRRSVLAGGVALAAGMLGSAWLLRRPARADHSPAQPEATELGGALILTARSLARPETSDGTLMGQRQVFLAGLHMAPEDPILWRGAGRLADLLMRANDVADRDHCLDTLRRLVAEHPEPARRHAPLLARVLAGPTGGRAR